MNEELKSELLFHASQSTIHQELKDAIANNLEKIPEDKAGELLKLFQEEKQGLAKIEEEFEQRLKNLKIKQ